MSRGPSGISFAAIAAAGGGALLGLSYPPSPWPYLSLVALIPLLMAWERSESASAAFFHGMVFYGLCFAVAFHWPLLHALPGVALASIVPMALLVIALAAPVAISWFARRRRGRVEGLLAFIGLHLLVEALLTRGPLALPWPLLGNALAEAESVRSMASVGGVALLSAWVLASNVLLYGVFDGGAAKRKWLASVAGAVLAGGWIVGGAMRPEVPNGQALRVAIVQPSLPAEKWASVDDRFRVERLVAMTESLYTASGQLPDLTVWPETALPPCAGRTICGDVSQALTALDVPGAPPLLSGAIVSETQKTSAGAADVAGPSAWYNAALLLSSGEEPLAYYKNRLVPFAEGVPFAVALPALARFGIDAGGVAGYVPGRLRPLMDAGGVTFGALICFESLFPLDVRDLTRRGAEVIVVLSQDGWWGPSFAHRQHLAFTRLRAIESGRPIVFAAATGISAVIAPDGRTFGEIPFGAALARVVAVRPGKGQTPFVRHGDWVPALAAVLGSVLVSLYAVPIALNRRRRRDG